MGDAVEVVRADVLSAVRHGFLGRRGGVSVGAVAGLNCGLGAGDDAAAVAENRARAVAAVAPPDQHGPARLVTVYQVHSALCVGAGDWADDARPHADALVSDRPGVVLGILTADCAPVLLADVAAGVIGAAHAGWKGAFGGVCEATVDAMVALGAERGRIVAAVGPCIAQASYEVDGGFRDRFIREQSFGEVEDPTVADEYFCEGEREGRWQFDLSGYVADRLWYRTGIARIESTGPDTYADADRFYSFRRATHRGEASYGRQISLIAL